MKRMRQRIIIAAALVAATSLCAVRSHADLFKLDFGNPQNDVTLADWDTFSDWSFTDFPRWHRHLETDRLFGRQPYQ